MRKINTLNVVLLSAIIITVCAVILQRYLPQKVLSAIPGKQFYLTYLYLDKPAESKTREEWVDQSQHSWSCITEEKDAYLICSYYLIISKNPALGWDLSDYTSLRLKLNYSGPAQRIRVIMRTFDKRFSKTEDANSAKFHAKTIRTYDFNKEVSIDLSEFTVADWWVDQFDLPRHLVSPDLSNVISFGIEFAEGLPPGDHRLTLEKLSFTGDWIPADKWYLGILVLWILGCLILLSTRMLALRKQTEVAHQHIDRLADSNTYLRSEKERFQTLSRLDALTGVYNRYAIDKTINQLLVDPRQDSIALIMIDIDHFKRINDRRGHDVGDHVLKQFTQLITKNIRNEDTLGRWGGEEFILILPKTSIDQAYYLAEKIRKIIADAAFIDEKPLIITASFGVGTILKNESFENTFKRIDAALYQAKAQGRNCTILADTAPVA